MIIKRYIVQLMHNESGKWIDVYSTSGKMGKRVKFKTIQKAQDCMNEFKKMNNSLTLRIVEIYHDYCVIDTSCNTISSIHQTMNDDVYFHNSRITLKYGEDYFIENINYLSNKPNKIRFNLIVDDNGEVIYFKTHGSVLDYAKDLTGIRIIRRFTKWNIIE